jgi:hypothetical protein
MKTFKVLMTADQFVDENLLPEGVYGTNVPTLHDSSYSIPKMIEKYKYVMSLMDAPNERIAKTIQNIKLCRMVTVNLQIPEYDGDMAG